MNFPSLDFTNWRDHPSDNRYVVFFFKTEKESIYFEELLKENKVWYEAFTDDDEPNYKYYFAVNKTSSKQVIHLNHRTVGEFRSHFIPYKVLRYALVVGMIIIMTLAIVGYIKGN